MFVKANKNTRCNTTGPSILGLHLCGTSHGLLTRALLRFSSMHYHVYWSENLISHFNGFICLDRAYCMDLSPGWGGGPVQLFISHCGCSWQQCFIPVLKMAPVLFCWFIFWWTTVQSLNSTPNTLHLFKVNSCFASFNVKPRQEEMFSLS